MQIASKTFKFVEKHSKKLSVESNLRSAKKANITKKQLKTKIPPGSTNQRWSKTVVSQTTESWRLEVHLPLPLFSSNDSEKTTWSWAFFFPFFRIIHSLHFFQILISRRRLVVFSMVCSLIEDLQWSPGLVVSYTLVEGVFSPLLLCHDVSSSVFSNILRFRQLHQLKAKPEARDQPCKNYQKSCAFAFVQRWGCTGHGITKSSPTPTWQPHSFQVGLRKSQNKNKWEVGFKLQKIRWMKMHQA